MEKTTSTSSLTESLRGAVGGEPEKPNLEGKLERSVTSSRQVTPVASLPRVIESEISGEQLVKLRSRTTSLRRQKEKKESSFSRLFSQRFSLRSSSSARLSGAHQADLTRSSDEVSSSDTTIPIDPSLNPTKDAAESWWEKNCNEIQAQITKICLETYNVLKGKDEDDADLIKQHMQCIYRRELDQECQNIIQSSALNKKTIERLRDDQIHEFCIWLNKDTPPQGESLWQNKAKGAVLDAISSKARNETNLTGYALGAFIEDINMRTLALLKQELNARMDIKVARHYICSSNGELCTFSTIVKKAKESAELILSESSTIPRITKSWLIENCKSLRIQITEICEKAFTSLINVPFSLEPHMLIKLNMKEYYKQQLDDYYHQLSPLLQKKGLINANGEIQEDTSQKIKQSIEKEMFEFCTWLDKNLIRKTENPWKIESKHKMILANISQKASVGLNLSDAGKKLLQENLQIQLLDELEQALNNSMNKIAQRYNICGNDGKLCTFEVMMEKYDKSIVKMNKEILGYTIPYQIYLSRYLLAKKGDENN